MAVNIVIELVGNPILLNSMPIAATKVSHVSTLQWVVSSQDDRCTCEGCEANNQAIGANSKPSCPSRNYTLAFGTMEIFPNEAD